jgi:hypothetical protein
MMKRVLLTLAMLAAVVGCSAGNVAGLAGKELVSGTGYGLGTYLASLIAARVPV